MGEYLPSAPVNDEAKKRNEKLPGQGGVFNHVNLHAYHYAGNNPVKLVDPDGRDDEFVRKLIDTIETTTWAKTNEGAKIVTILKELNAAGRITIHDTPSDDGKIGGGYDVSGDSISMIRQKSRFGFEEMVAALGHEGMHALQYREGDVGYDPGTPG